MPIDYKRLRGLTVKDIVNALLRDGFYLRNQRGSHQRYFHNDGRKVTVTYHKSSDTFGPKLLKTMIEDQAQWTDEDLMRLKLL